MRTHQILDDYRSKLKKIFLFWLSRLSENVYTYFIFELYLIFIFLFFLWFKFVADQFHSQSSISKSFINNQDFTLGKVTISCPVVELCFQIKMYFVDIYLFIHFTNYISIEQYFPCCWCFIVIMQLNKNSFTIAFYLQRIIILNK